MQQEVHPFLSFAPEKSRILIVGTFPPTQRNWSYDFFYPNKQNLFWTIMSKIAGTELTHFAGVEAVEERKQILTLLKVAITDMGHTIERVGGSSLDENLIIIKYMDIFKLLDENPLITKLVFTSSSGPVSAVKWFNSYLKSQNVIHKFPKGLKPIKSQFEFKNRIIKLSILYSPSRRAANRISLSSLVELYKAEILS